MKYVKSYLLTATFLTGVYFVGYQAIAIASKFAEPEDILKYLVFLGITTGLAGPVGLYINESKKQ